MSGATARAGAEVADRNADFVTPFHAPKRAFRFVNGCDVATRSIIAHQCLAIQKAANVLKAIKPEERKEKPYC